MGTVVVWGTIAGVLTGACLRTHPRGFVMLLGALVILATCVPPSPLRTTPSYDRDRPAPTTTTTTARVTQVNADPVERSSQPPVQETTGTARRDEAMHRRTPEWHERQRRYFEETMHSKR